MSILDILSIFLFFRGQNLVFKVFILSILDMLFVIFRDRGPARPSAKF